MDKWIFAARWSAALLIGSLLTISAEELEIFEITASEVVGDEVTFDFNLNAFSIGDFDCQTTTDLGLWGPDANASLTFHGGDSFQVISTNVSDTRQFFRIVQKDTFTDTDGDGLSDGLETLIGSDPLVADTDSDGWADGLEVGTGSDPNAAQSLPNHAIVGFEEPRSSVKEGDGIITIPLVCSLPFTGQVHYTIDALGQAEADIDYALPSGTTTLTNGEGAITLSILDDLDPEDVDMLVIDLKTEALEGYLATGAIRHTVLIYDNDRTWSGLLRNDTLNQSFRVQILRNESTVEATIMSSANPDSESGVQGTGGIPEGSYPMQGEVFSADTFTAISSAIPVGTSPLFGSPNMSRFLTLSVVPPDEGDSSTSYGFEPNRLVGTFTDALVSQDAAFAHLNSETSGLLILVADLPIFEQPEIPAESGL